MIMGRRKDEKKKTERAFGNFSYPEERVDCCICSPGKSPSQCTIMIQFRAITITKEPIKN